MNNYEPHLLLEGLRFAEGPRYHDGQLYVSDMHGGEVLAITSDGSRRQVAMVRARPSGLGWLPDGTMLVVSMIDRKVLALRDDRLVVHAELAHIATGHCNDMVLDAQGRAYVGNFGFDMDAGAPVVPARLALVEADGTARTVAEDLLFPNGMVITPDGKTLIVAETYGQRLTAFDIAADGSLDSRRIWAELQVAPDGICLDAAGAVWVSNPVGEGGFHRIAEGGEVLDHVSSGDRKGIACMLGGPERTTLFLVEAFTFNPHKSTHGNARVRSVQVPVPGAGFPAAT